MDVQDDPERQRETSAALIQLLYPELKRVARRERARVGSPATLQTTALIHEAYLKLHRSAGWNDRQHFLRAAAAAMRQVLVDAARARLAQKRGGGQPVVSLDEEHAESIAAVGVTSDDTLISIDAALNKLGLFSRRLAQVVECRFFAGYSEEETADALEVTTRTVERDWVKARAWLYRELNPTE